MHNGAQFRIIDRGKSGSFKSYSENMEKYKKALASALKKLALEI